MPEMPADFRSLAFFSLRLGCPGGIVRAELQEKVEFIFPNDDLRTPGFSYVIWKANSAR